MHGRLGFWCLARSAYYVCSGVVEGREGEEAPTQGWPRDRQPVSPVRAVGRADRPSLFTSQLSARGTYVGSGLARWT